MKDGYMVFVLIAVMMTPFLPLLLKSKCPACGKRKLEGLDAAVAPPVEEGKFTSYFHCKACEKDFKREKSGPLEPVALEYV